MVARGLKKIFNGFTLGRIMNQSEYLQYLGKLVGHTFKNKMDLYGLFSLFLPSGKGVEKVFAPIQNDEVYLDRLYRVYSDINPIKPSNSIFSEIGLKYLSNLKHLAKIINDQELTDILTSISRVSIIDKLEGDYSKSEEYMVLYDVVGDWLCDIKYEILNDDFVDSAYKLLACLDEAYYSIDCDYWLSYYLQWPFFKFECEIDVFEPYYLLWKNALGCSFDEDSIIIGH